MPPSQKPGLNRIPSLRRKKDSESETQLPNSTLTRKGSLRRSEQAPSLTRRPSLRRDKEETERLLKIQASPSTRRREFGLPEVPATSRRGNATPTQEVEGSQQPGRRETPNSPSVSRREAPSPSATPNLRRKGSIRHTLESLRKAAGKEERESPTSSHGAGGQEQGSKPPSMSRSGVESGSGPSLSRSGSLRGRRGDASGGVKETQVEDLQDNFRLTSRYQNSP